jgi:hypothetical protein
MNKRQRKKQAKKEYFQYRLDMLQYTLEKLRHKEQMKSSINNYK